MEVSDLGIEKIKHKVKYSMNRFVNLGSLPRVSNKDIQNSIANKYTAWVDMMGIRSRMLKSIVQASTMILRMHGCISELVNKSDGCEFYPVMDGCYIVSDDLNLILTTLSQIHRKFLGEVYETKTYLIMLRSSVAYGEMLLLENLPESSDFLKRVNKNPKLNHLLFGKALVQAYGNEKGAIPFGIVLDDNVSVNNSSFVQVDSKRYYKWFDGIEDILKNAFCNALKNSGLCKDKKINYQDSFNIMINN